MKTMVGGFTAVMVAVLLTGPAHAQEFFVYPNEGQSNDQMEKDKYECYQWAKAQSGFDPMAPPTTSTPPPEQKVPTAHAAKGAFGGAFGGAIIGGIADDDPGKGAAIGAVGGGLIGGMRRQSQKKQHQQKQQQWEQQEVAGYQQKRNSYNRAYTACLEGLDYTVK